MPLLTRCYESAVAARDLAGAIKKGIQAPLRLALSNSVSLELFIPPLTELVRAFPGLELKFLRGNASDIVRALKAGDTAVKYGEDIGRIVADIGAGGHVHTHNLKTKRW